jgi:hypothetical protein
MKKEHIQPGANENGTEPSGTFIELPGYFWITLREVSYCYTFRSGVQEYAQGGGSWLLLVSPVRHNICDNLFSAFLSTFYLQIYRNVKKKPRNKRQPSF